MERLYVFLPPSLWGRAGVRGRTLSPPTPTLPHKEGGRKTLHPLAMRSSRKRPPIESTPCPCRAGSVSDRYLAVTYASGSAHDEYGVLRPYGQGQNGGYG